MAKPRAPLVRVLVVDDSVVIRRMIANAIEADERLEMAGYAENGKVAMARLATLRPDVVTLDLDMPTMNGFETLKAIRAIDPDLPIIVFSRLTERGAEATVEAMTLGASAYVLKPTADHPGSVEKTLHELTELIIALASHSVSKDASASQTVAARAAKPIARPRRAATRTDPPKAIVIAVSTGGPSALATLVSALPANLPVPILVVQHMPPMFTTRLAERLNNLSDLTITEASHNEPVVAGHIYIAPGGHHLAVTVGDPTNRIAIQDGPPENSSRPAADVLFRSAAKAYGGRVLAVVMTGMGRDGLRGTEIIVAAGGTAVAQSQETCVVGSMPAAIANADLADAVLPLSEIAAYLVRRTAKPGRRT